MNHDSDPPLTLDHTRQLFLDDHVIQWTDKAERRVMAATKHPRNPLVEPTEAWEPAGYIVYGSVLYDRSDRLYKMWAFGTDAQPERSPHGCPSSRQGVFYFVSDDGLTWNRPGLDVVLVDGRRTNIVVPGPESGHSAVLPHWYELYGVSKDERDEDPRRRFKMGYNYIHRDYEGPDPAPFHPGQRRGLGVAFSPDGVHWTPHGDLVTRATQDGPTFWHFDECAGRWMLYGRTRYVDPAVRARWGRDAFFQRNHWGRAVNRAESTDFLRWEPDEGERVLHSDVLDGPQHEIYGMSVFAYEGLYIGLVQVFLNYRDRDHLEIQLAVSRDGRRFERLSDRSPFIPVGDVGSWDRFNNSIANNPPLRVDDELWFYYAGRSYLHPGAGQNMADNGLRCGVRALAGVGLATIRRDRMVALQASFDAGVVRTRPLTTAARRLCVNAAVRFGRLNITARTPAGEAIEGLETDLLRKDGTDMVALEGLDALQGRPFVLEFTLHNGRLFAFWAE